MKIYRFDENIGQEIKSFDSQRVILSKIAKLSGRVQIACMHLKPQGVIGYHQARVPQLFLVVRGEGWVRGRASKRYVIETGQAAFWERDEWHESGTETGMMAIVVESEMGEFDPSEHMTEIELS